MTQTVPVDGDGNLYFLAMCDTIATSHLEKRIYVSRGSLDNLPSFTELTVLQSS